MKLSTAQSDMLNRVYLSGGTWVSNGWTVALPTVKALVNAGLVTYSRVRKFNAIGTAPGGYVTWVYTITATDEGLRVACLAACVKRSRETLMSDIAEWGCE